MGRERSDDGQRAYRYPLWTINACFSLLLPTSDMRGGHTGSTNGPGGDVGGEPGTRDTGSWGEKVHAASKVGVGRPGIGVISGSNGQGLHQRAYTCF